jgi:hypothetical protein
MRLRSGAQEPWPSVRLGRWLARAALAGAAALTLGALARADDGARDEAAKLFADGVHALEQQRPTDAVDDFEAVADRGVIDATASYDRGLAYAMRIHMGAEQPGDLGRAAHGFEEARELADDDSLRRDAQTALAAVRSEVARRKARQGSAVDMDQHAAPWRALTHALPENTWAALALTAALVFGCALFLRWLSSSSRARAGAAIAIATSLPVLVLAAALTRSARRDRLELREAIVISPSVRPSDSRGVVLSGGATIPEAARVELREQEGAFTEVRWGTLDAWVPTTALRPLAKAP